MISLLLEDRHALPMITHSSSAVTIDHRATVQTPQSLEFGFQTVIFSLPIGAVLPRAVKELADQHGYPAQSFQDGCQSVH